MLEYTVSMTIKISVITCTYNSEKFLEKCLKSVENQKYKNIEHIFNDGYSSDRTVEIIKKYIERNKDKYPIKFMQSAPRGVANALNVALKLAEGDVVHYLHSDDYYESRNSLSRVVQLFEENPQKKWITGNLIVEFKGRRIKLPFTHILKLNPKYVILSLNWVQHDNTFVYRELYEKYGGFQESNKVTVEYRLWLRIMKDYEPLIVDDTFTVFIIHKGSTSTGSPLSLTRGIIECYKTLGTEKILPLIKEQKNRRVYKVTMRAYKKMLNFKEFIKKIEFE